MRPPHWAELWRWSRSCCCSSRSRLGRTGDTGDRTGDVSITGIFSKRIPTKSSWTSSSLNRSWHRKHFHFSLQILHNFEGYILITFYRKIFFINKLELPSHKPFYLLPRIGDNNHRSQWTFLFCQFSFSVIMSNTEYFGKTFCTKKVARRISLLVFLSNTVFGRTVLWTLFDWAFSLFPVIFLTN